MQRIRDVFDYMINIFGIDMDSLLWPRFGSKVDSQPLETYSTVARYGVWGHLILEK
jgi:hypothetical protein